MTIPRVLVIAGSDSSGGAGLEADQRVLAVHGCYAMTATTALTAQNTLGVEDVLITPPIFVRKQIDLCLNDIGCDIIKIGMLASTETIKVVAEALKDHDVHRVVLDPVMVATSGAQLLPKDAVRNLRTQLIPLTTILTPNIPEAILLLQDAEIDCEQPSNLDDLRKIAKSVQQLGADAVLLKGGHMPLTKSYIEATSDDDRNITVDVLYDGIDFTVIESDFQPSKNTHGTGCSLASAIAANIASGFPNGSLAMSVRKAVSYVSAGIITSSSSLSSEQASQLTSITNTAQKFSLQTRGPGPINHFHSLFHLPFSPGSFIDTYLLPHPKVAPTWKKFTHHAFPTQMAKSTLPEPLFKSYLIQDYLYLTHFARTHALAGYKSSSMSSITTAGEIIGHIRHEMDLHLSYCSEMFGISQSEIENTPESLACTAYSRYVLDLGLAQDWLAIQVALAPCLIGYNVVAERLACDRTSVKGKKNKYWRWFENYTALDYREAVSKGRRLVEENIVRQSPSRIEELVDIFVKATEMEVRFWDFDTHSFPEEKVGPG